VAIEQLGNGVLAPGTKPIELAVGFVSVGHLASRDGRWRGDSKVHADRGSVDAIAFRKARLRVFLYTKRSGYMNGHDGMTGGGAGIVPARCGGDGPPLQSCTVIPGTSLRSG
jgi:hypothetical protein